MSLFKHCAHTSPPANDAQGSLDRQTHQRSNRSAITAANASQKLSLAPTLALSRTGLTGEVRRRRSRSPFRP